MNCKSDGTVRIYLYSEDDPTGPKRGHADTLLKAKEDIKIDNSVCSPTQCTYSTLGKVLQFMYVIIVVYHHNSTMHALLPQLIPSFYVCEYHCHM